MKIKQIKQIRIRNNLKQKDIAEFLNVDRTTYTGWELGTNTIPLKKLILLCNYYKIDIDYILDITKKEKHIISNYCIKNEIIGKNLRKIRKNNNLTQKDIAKFLNISVSSYTLYELGKILIPTEYLYKFSRKFKCSINEIIKTQV